MDTRPSPEKAVPRPPRHPLGSSPRSPHVRSPRSPATSPTQYPPPVRRCQRGKPPPRQSPQPPRRFGAPRDSNRRHALPRPGGWGEMAPQPIIHFDLETSTGPVGRVFSFEPSLEKPPMANDARREAVSGLLRQPGGFEGLGRGVKGPEPNHPGVAEGPHV